MEKPSHNKLKNKKQGSKPKSTKKQKNNAPTCSMFISEISRKLALKKKQEEESQKNIVKTIIESFTNCLPGKFSKKSPLKKESPMEIETLQIYAPVLLPSDTISIHPTLSRVTISPLDIENPIKSTEIPKVKGFKMPKMPLVNSDLLKQPRVVDKAVTESVAINTSSDHDVAGEIAKYVGTLRKISLITEEFNQKTAKNLKEIVDSVQEDLLKKLEEMKTDQRASISRRQISIDKQ